MGKLETPDPRLRVIGDCAIVDNDARFIVFLCNSRGSIISYWTLQVLCPFIEHITLKCVKPFRILIRHPQQCALYFAIFSGGAKLVLFIKTWRWCIRIIGLQSLCEIGCWSKLRIYACVFWLILVWSILDESGIVSSSRVHNEQKQLNYRACSLNESVLAAIGDVCFWLIGNWTKWKSLHNSNSECLVGIVRQSETFVCTRYDHQTAQL